MIVEFDARALSDLDEIRDGVALDSPVAAERMHERLASACRGLVQFPLRGRASRRRGLRELTTVRPYIVFYTVGVDAVRIRRVIHGARLR